jgi:hypothetical protein
MMLPYLEAILGRRPMDAAVRQTQRFMLWIDAVGGYWVCMGDSVIIGRADARRTAELPLLGDLAARHACVRRDGEGYLIEAYREVRVDGRSVHDCDWLRDGSRIQLGESVGLVFRRPHAFSGTARLDFASGQRTQPSADGVLLMADTCVLGPAAHSHVVCRDWTREAVVYRRGQELYCRAAGKFRVDGAACDGCGKITTRSRVEGDGFTFNLEPITV